MVLTASDVANYVSRFEQTVKDPRKRCLKKLDIAKLYKEAKCFDLAIEYGREYLKVNPKDHRAYNLLGAASEELEDWENALKYYKRSVEIQRNQKDILIKIVDAYSKVCHDEPDVAKVWADKADTVIPCHPAIFNLRWSLLAQCDNKDFEEMEDLLAQELVRRPREPELHVKLLELYMEKGDFQEAYAHCRSLLFSHVFQNNKDWLLCSAEVFSQFHQNSVGGDENVFSFMYYAYVLCCLLTISFKASTVIEARDVFQRLDEAGRKIYVMETSTMSADLQDEFEVFRTEIRGQLYFFLALLNYKMAQEDEISWSYAARLASPCLTISSSIPVPDKKVGWLQRKPHPENERMLWYDMACLRRSQSDHMLLSIEREMGSKWIQTRVSDICTRPGKNELMDHIYGEISSNQKSLLMTDKEFLMTEYETPDLELLEICDQVTITGNPGNFDLLIWLGISNHFTRSSKFDAPKIASELFFGIQFDVDDLENCSPFTLSVLDIEVFIEAVIYSCVDRLLNDDRHQSQCEPMLLPLAIRESLSTNSQSDLWDAAFRLHTGKTWQVSTSKLKSILQRGLEALRAHGCHGIDPAILDHVAKIFLAKADEIQNEQEDNWTSQLDIESCRRRGFRYADEALKLLEISEGGQEIARPRNPLIPPLLKRVNESDRAEMIEGLRMMLADAAFRNDECTKALGYLNGLFTADGAYKQAQIYRDLASRENHSNVEGLRSHLSFLRKSRDMLQVCLQRLDKTQVALCDKIQAEIEEIKDAIAEQSGISRAPSKVLDFRYSSDETEDESDMFREKGVSQDESTTEAKLALENSILHEQLAIRNHEFSVLASRIHKLEREMSEMRASQSTSESVIKPRQNSGVNTDESSSSAAYVPKDDFTSGSGNLTPRLEPEMSWDPFSPAPVFPVGFFSGLVDTIEKLDEETEDEVRKANSSSPVSSVMKIRTPDMPAREESVSCGDEEASFGDTLHVEPLVSLTRKSDLTTGEENEEVVFKERAKLYRLHEGQWKERGLGDIKILLDKRTSKARILMRREKVLKVCANHLLTAEMQLTKKVESPNTYVWCTPADLSDAEPVSETFAVRFKTVESGEEFSKVFTKYKNVESGRKKEVSNTQTPEEKEESQVSFGDNEEKEQNAASAAPFFDFTKFSQKSAEESGAAKALIKVNSDVKQQKDEKSSTEKKQNGAESVDGKSSLQSAGFVFDAAKFNFNASKTQVASDNSQNLSPDRNPFLNAIQNLSSSRTSPFAFGRFEGANDIGSSSPIGAAQTHTQVSTPSTSNLFQRATFALAESTPNSDNFVSPIGEAGFGSEQHIQEYQVNDYLNATAQGSSFVNNRASDQAGYYQSEWESIQDRYYDAAYDEHNGYYDGSSFYQNDDYQNDGEYYTAEDVYYGDEGAYYSNSEQGFEYYDQEPPRDIPPADSDANSDRLSQPEGAVSSEELVPHVVQMIDDDIFVTYVKKASFAQRARASRLQLPPNFFAPSLYPPSSYRGRGKEEENSTQYHRVTSVFAQDVIKAEQRPIVFGAAGNGAAAIVKDTKGQQFLSFADLVKSQGTFANRIQASNSSFSGAGAMLFTAKEEPVEGEFDPTFKPIVELKRKEDLKTGEEGYEDLFKNRAKLFRFDFDLKQWKERGVGDMRLSYNPETSYCRVIMRRDQVLKLCANHPVMPDIELKPHGMSCTSWLWVSGADYSEGEPQMQQFAVKFKSKEIADEFKHVFQDCQKRIVKYLDELNSNESEVCTALSGAQLSSASIVSPSRSDTPEEELAIVYIKEPSVSEEEKASRLLLPKTFFSPPSAPPCPGGSGFQMSAREKMKNATDVSAILREETKQEERQTTFLSFADLASSTSGSSSAFQSHGRGFHAAGTALFTSPKQDEDPNAFDPTFKPIVELKKKENLKTGEEGYEDLFKNRAKLFRFDFDLKQWKERGVGDMRLSYNPETSYCRVIMRRDQVLKLCANHPVMPDIELKPHGMSCTSWLWVSGADYSEGEPQMQQFAVKFKSKEIADEFKHVFQSCQQIIRKYLIDNDMQVPGLETSDEAVKLEHKSKSEEQVEPEDETKLESDTASAKEAEPEKEDQFAPSTLNSVAKLHEGGRRDVVSSSPWTHSLSFATENVDDSTCSSSNATKGQSTLEAQSSGELFCMPAFSFGPASTATAFGGISFGATDTSMLMKSTFGDVNEINAKASESRTPQSAASEGASAATPFGVFGVKEGETCMLQKDKEKVNCVSVDTNSLSSELAGSSQGSSVSKSFGKFKMQGGSWECQTCMLPNDRDKVKCVSCGADNPSSESSSLQAPAIEQTSSNFMFGSQRLCMLQNDKDKVDCISVGAKNLSSDSAAPRSAGSSQGSSVSKSFGKFKAKEGSWECQTCMLPNDRDKVKCISCGADNPSSESSSLQAPAIEQNSSNFMFGNQPSCMLQNDKDKVDCTSVGAKNLSLDSAAPRLAGSSQGSSVSKSFGKFKAKEGSWECQTCMLPNDRDKVKCTSCGADNPSSESSSLQAPAIEQNSSNFMFGNQPSCMLQNDKEKVDCTSVGAKSLSSESAAPRLAGSSQGSSISKSFGKFKAMEGSWECETCMLPNDRDKVKCISCGTDNPSSESSSLQAPAIEQTSSNFMFGNQPLFSFTGNANPVPFGKSSFSMPLFSIGSASDEKTEDATQDAKHNFAFKPPSFSFQDNKQFGNVESSSSASSIALKEEKPSAGLFGTSGGLGSRTSMFGAPFGAMVHPNDGILGNLLSTNAGPFRFGDSDVGVKATNDKNGEKSEIFKPVGNIFATPKSEAISISSVQPVSTQSHSMTNAFTPKSPESPSKEGGILCNPLVSLQRLNNLKTGEEEEIAIFNEKAKLYRYDANGKEWKERGVGELKILQKRDALNTYRLVMRRDQIRKLCANHFLVPGMVLKGMPSSEKMKIWTTTADFADEEVKKETFAVRFKSLDILEAFESAFNKATVSESNEQQTAKYESSESRVNDRSRDDCTNGEEEKGVKQEQGAIESEVAAEEKGAEEDKAGEEDKGAESVKGAKENKVAEIDKEAMENKGAENDEEAKENKGTMGDTGAEEEAGVEELDVEVTGVLLPSSADQDRAEKLLLPKGFFNKSTIDDTDDTVDLAMSAFKTPGKAKVLVGEIFASPKVSLFSSSTDAIPQKEPESPEKFSEDCSASFTPIVQLEKVATETGEESEIVLFCDKAKLYRYDAEGRQWKERGVGDLKILKNTQNQSLRIIMRRDQVKKVCLNHGILPGMNLEFMGSRKNTLIWFTHADYSDEEVKAEKFAARFKSELAVTKFKECFDSVIKEGSELFSPKKTQEERAVQSAEVQSAELARNVNVKQDINEQEDEKQQEVRKKELVVPSGMSNTKDSSLTFQSIGSFANVFSKSEGPTTAEHKTTLPPFEQLSNFQEPSSLQATASTKDTTNLQGTRSRNLFSFGKSPATVSETGNTFSWPVSGTQKLFSIGSLGTSSTPTLSFPAAEIQDPGKLVSENVYSNNQNFGSFTFNWPKTESGKSDSIKGPFSFSSVDNQAVEKLSINDGNKGNKNNIPSFSWGGLAPVQGSSVFSVGFSKEIPRKEVEKRIVDSSHSPEKSDEKETYDPSEAIVTLERIESSSGEEGEMPIFIEWAKAYRFDTETKEWKERGRGNVKILQNKTTGQYRLIMRRDQVKKIAINHVLTTNMKLEENSASKSSWIWFTNADFSDEVAKPEKLAVRFKTEEISMRFKNAFDQAVKEVNAGPNSGTVSEDKTLRSLEKLTEAPKVNVFVDSSLSANDELVITYVKEATAEEQAYAEQFRLPSTFFAPVSEIQSRKKNEGKPKASVAAIRADDSHKIMPSIMNSNGLTFADLVSKSTDAFSSFSSSPGRLQEFKGQGSVLFGRKEEDHEGADEGDYLSFKPIVSLTKTETKTGEEEEEVMFAERCKLYRFDKDNSQWKERGVGDMKILYNSRQRTSRIIMRRDVVFKLGANHVIQPGMEVTSKEGRENTWMWKTNADFADEEPKEEAFTVKFRSADIGKKFAEVFEKCLIRAEKEDQHEEKDEESGKVVGQVSPQRCFDTRAEKPVAPEEIDSVLLTGHEGLSPMLTYEGKADSLAQNSKDENDHKKQVLSTQRNSSQIDSEVNESGTSGNLAESRVMQSVSRTDSDVNESGTSGNLAESRVMQSEAEEKETLQSNTFGSQFSAPDFSALAQSGANAFTGASKGGFVNAGAKLFGSETENYEGQNPRLEAIVQLEQVESKSGEENEDVLFENRVKLYRFFKETKEWKERGVGVIKLLRHRSTKLGRLIMRRDTILKIAANHALTKGMKLDDSRSSTRTLAWTALADVSDDEPAESMFAVKFKSDEVLREFSRVFHALCSGDELQAWEGKRETEHSTQASATGFCSPEIRQELQNYIDENTSQASK